MTGGMARLQLLEWWEAELRAAMRADVGIRWSKTFRICSRRLSGKTKRKRGMRPDELLGLSQFGESVGRLVLYLGRCHEERSCRGATRSAPACSWRTLARRGPRFSRGASTAGRLQRFGVEKSCSPLRRRGMRDLLAFEVEREQLLRSGLPLVDAMPRGFREASGCLLTAV
jgi:hypothetical protein